MFTGLYPSEHHADWGHGHLVKGLPTLGEQLQGAGYQTV
jgi:arylsulfatase A-like enzyme